MPSLPMAVVLVPDTKQETPGRRPALRPEPGFRSRLGWASRDILDTVTADGLAHQGYPWKLQDRREGPGFWSGGSGESLDPGEEF